jgi:hypothetical protein
MNSIICALSLAAKQTLARHAYRAPNPSMMSLAYAAIPRNVNSLSQPRDRHLPDRAIRPIGISPRNAFVASLVDASFRYFVRSVAASPPPHVLFRRATVRQLRRASSRTGELVVAIQVVGFKAQ